MSEHTRFHFFPTSFAWLCCNRREHAVSSVIMIASLIISFHDRVQLADGVRRQKVRMGAHTISVSVRT
jgi:hypothetical protein